MAHGADEFAHIGPGTLAGEYLRCFWHPVMRSCDLKPGWAKPLRIFGEDFTIYRGERGQVHIIDFRCAHRGTQLSTGWVEGDELRCFYHGWKYDGNGQCVEQPCEQRPFAARVKIGGWPAREYHSLIFAYLGKGSPPDFPIIEPFEVPGAFYFDVDTFVRPCNYFQVVENHLDPAHVSFTHRESAFDKVALTDIPVITAEETEYGIVHRMARPGRPVRVAHFIMPNSGWHVSSPDAGGILYETMRWRVPVDDEHTVNFALRRLEAETTEQAEAWLQRLRGAGDDGEHSDDPRPDEGRRLAREVLEGTLQTSALAAGAMSGHGIGYQDDVAQLGQGVIVDRSREHLGRSDVAIVLLRRIWRREMRALAEGRPIKRWHMPQGVRPTAGVGTTAGP